MANLNMRQLQKRNNWQIFISMIEHRKSFKTLNGADVVLGYASSKKNKEFVNKLSSSTIEHIFEELTVGQSVIFPKVGGSIRITELLKTEEFGGKIDGKETFERQEIEFCNIVNSYKTINIDSGKHYLENIYGALKCKDLNAYNYESYTDVILLNDDKKIKISMKGLDTPSLAGGGLEGLHRICPKICIDALDMATSKLMEYGYKTGDKVQAFHANMFYKIPKEHNETIVRGTDEMNGNIDYIYQGPMSVTAEHVDNTTIRFNGNLKSVEEIADTDLYLRIRRRTNDQVFTDIKTDKYGYPSVFTSDYSANRRVSVVSKNDIPSNAIKLNED